jgi:hypothetical protein
MITTLSTKTRSQGIWGFKWLSTSPILFVNSLLHLLDPVRDDPQMEGCLARSAASRRSVWPSVIYTSAGGYPASQHPTRSAGRQATSGHEVA